MTTTAVSPTCSSRSLRSLRLSREELARRVILKNAEVVLEEIARGKPVFLLGAHQCNWEWMLLALSNQLGMPVDAAYKPLGDSWAECELRKLRSRLGARMIPAQELLGDIIKQRGTPRAIAILADQEPKTGERKQWVRFLNRDTAFYIGPGGDGAQHALSRVFPGHQAHLARPLRSGVSCGSRRRASSCRPANSRLDTRAWSRSRSAPRRPTGRGRTSAGSSKNPLYG